MNIRTDSPSPPPARTWLLAVAELVAALVAARLIVTAARPTAAGHRHAAMAGRPESDLSTVMWGWLDYTLLVLAAATFGWWLLRRSVFLVIATAAALTAFATSPATRALACESHLVAMIGLELLMVAIPLLMLSALPRAREPSPSRPPSRGWMIFGVVTALLYSGFLIGIHIPTVHFRGAEMGAAPLWVAFTALAVGIAYWFCVVAATGRIPATLRRRLLIGAQELAAFIGLLTLFGAWGTMASETPLRISAVWDQRLGGLVMMAACAAVAVPILRRITDGGEPYDSQVDGLPEHLHDLRS